MFYSLLILASTLILIWQIREVTFNMIKKLALSHTVIKWQGQDFEPTSGPPSLCCPPKWYICLPTRKVEWASGLCHRWRGPSPCLLGPPGVTRASVATVCPLQWLLNSSSFFLFAWVFSAQTESTLPRTTRKQWVLNIPCSPSLSRTIPGDVLLGLSEGPRKMEPHLPTLAAGSWHTLWWLSCHPCLTSPILVFLGISSWWIHLSRNPFLRVCFWGNPN